MGANQPRVRLTITDVTGTGVASNLYAQVILDLPLPHLDHVFDYKVRPEQFELAKVGVRVRVPFRNRRIDGFIVSLSDSPTVSTRIAEIENIISPEVVLTQDIFKLCQMVAYRNVGNTYDVIKAAVPPRHVRAEKKQIALQPREIEKVTPVADSNDEIAEFILNNEQHLLAVFNQDITQDPLDLLINIANIAKNIIFLLPDQYDVQNLVGQISSNQLRSRISILTAQQSSEQRYLEFRRVLHGVTDIVIGTRSAVFAPIASPTVIVVVDDGDDLYTSPQAPYWKARDVAIARSELQKAKVIFFARAQSIESAENLMSGNAIEISPKVTERVNSILIADDQVSETTSGLTQFLRMPSQVFTAIREGLNSGIVLISVPRKGYQPIVACQTCHEILRCISCGGSIGVKTSGEFGTCNRCNSVKIEASCSFCGGVKFRTLVSGIERTAEEIGKAFPGKTVKFIDADNRIESDAATLQIVVAMPGTEPNMSFASIVVLDSHVFLARPEGNSRIRFLRHLFNLRGKLNADGKMVVVGNSENHVLQAFVRSDPRRIGASLLEERTVTRLSPFAKTAQVFGEWKALESVKYLLPDYVQFWGSVATAKSSGVKHPAMALISVPKRDSDLLVKTLRSWLVTRSANGEPPVTIKMDPDDL